MTSQAEAGKAFEFTLFTEANICTQHHLTPDSVEDFCIFAAIDNHYA